MGLNLSYKTSAGWIETNSISPVSITTGASNPSIQYKFEFYTNNSSYSPELYNQWNHELQSLWAFDIDPRYNTSKHHIEEMKRPLKYTIPFKVIYNLDTIDFNFNQSEEQIKNRDFANWDEL